MPQSFLEAGEQGLLVAALDIDNAPEREPGLGEGRREQVGPRHAPQHLAAAARRDAGGEPSGGRAVLGAVAVAGDLMERPAQQPSFRKNPVDHRQAEGQDCALMRDPAL
jgi:hypothetical protein